MLGEPLEQRVDVLRLDGEQQHPCADRGLGQVDRGDAVALGELGGPVGAALADEDAVGAAAPDQAGEQRLADLAAADDRQAAAAGGGHARPTRRAHEAAAPAPEGTATRTVQTGGDEAALLGGADSVGHDVLPAVGRAAVPGRPLTGDGDQSGVGGGDGGAAAGRHQDVEAADEGQVGGGAAAGDQPHPAGGQLPAARLRVGLPGAARRRPRRGGRRQRVDVGRTARRARRRGRRARGRRRPARPRRSTGSVSSQASARPAARTPADEGGELRGGVVRRPRHRARARPRGRRATSSAATRTASSSAPRRLAAQRARRGRRRGDDGHVETVVRRCVPRPGPG